MTTDAEKNKDKGPQDKPVTPKGPKPNTASVEKAPPKQQRRDSYLGWLLLIIVIALVSALGWYGYRYWLPNYQMQTATLEARQQHLENQIESFQEQLDKQQEQTRQHIRQQLDQFSGVLSSHLQEQKQRINDYQQAVQSVQAELAALDISQETDWRILEARNMTDRAAVKLWIDQDPKAALELLKLAESHLAALDNPAHQSARQALADDIMLLRSLPEPKQYDAAMQLNSLYAQLQDANWYQRRASRDSSAESGATTTNWWERLKQRAGTLTDQLVRVQYRDKPVQPMLSDSYIELIQQRTFLQLQLAQQAALTGRQPLYEATIDTALNLLEEAGDPEHKGLQFAHEELTKLRGLTLQPDYPEELKSPAFLNRLANQITAGAAE
ncbi:uroporphyrinogen-III C-methyltransferase [Pseudidiomarina sp.]|uniref:uroporphyrinogen-III C-methyltransferase n=1 Tax=Pseudidiomarina sp. TaxID=2081707 RepID=UPI00299D043D|nr:uroporphyrinogen-III C-methyltransferase [Pseudidiomarina sp.]MDX1705877.1 uroporphyrinogen-III C-methyltransferase [Pseudidiomarina sp.]